MIGTETQLPVGDGALAALDFGGDGTRVLLVHGTGQNAAAWSDVAERLISRCHAIALDLRGHGRTPLDSSSAEQYWRDVGAVARRWPGVVLVGHSTGGYAVTALTAAGLARPAAVALVDGAVLDDRAAAAAAQARWSTDEAREQLRRTFRYGWQASEPEMEAYIEQCAGDAPTDWLNAGARPELVREVTRRSFSRREGTWLRRPTLEEIAVVGSPDPTAETYPSVEEYDRLGCPVTIVLATRGLYADRRSEIEGIVSRRAGWRLVQLDSNHNVPMARPAELAEVILDVVESAA